MHGGASPKNVSDKASPRVKEVWASLGSGNHFSEVSYV